MFGAAVLLTMLNLTDSDDGEVDGREEVMTSAFTFGTLTSSAACRDRVNQFKE